MVKQGTDGSVRAGLVTYCGYRAIDLSAYIRSKSKRMYGTCLIWQGARVAGKNGSLYGKTVLAGDSVYVHRLMYTLEIADIDAGMHVYRTCGNSLCVNPAHAYVDKPQRAPSDAV